MTAPEVVHVIAPQPVGGAESVVRCLALESHRRGRGGRVIALVEHDAPHPFVEGLRAEGVLVATVPCARHNYLRQVREVARELDRARPTVVHTHIYHADVVGFLAARRCGLPVVSTVHGITGSGWKNGLYIAIDFFLLGHFDAVVCVSDSLDERLRGSVVAKERLHIVPNGYTAGEFVGRGAARTALGLPMEELCVGWVGRMTREKGADTFVEVVATAGPEVRGVLIGDGPELDPVRDRARDLGAAERFHFVGQRHDAASLLPAFDVLVISSRSEASPVVLFEAMAAGVPVVAFAVGNIADVLDTVACGWVVPAGDRSALVAALRSAIGDPCEAARRAEVAQRVVAERFGVDAWLRQLDVVYASVTDATFPV